PSSTWASPQTNTRYATAHALASFGTGAVTADTSPPAAMQPVPVITKGALSAYWACLIDPMVRGGDSQFRWRQLGHQGRIGTDHTERRSAARRSERRVPAGQRLGEEAGVVGEVRLEIRWQVVLVVDGFDRAHRFARAAVDAFVGMDVE